MDLHVDIVDLALISALAELQSKNSCFVAYQLLHRSVDQRVIRAHYNRLRDVLKYVREENGVAELTSKGWICVGEVLPIIRTIMSYRPEHIHR